ncbi:dATP/dGTP diphosphohydrolase domain-containing protein [Rhizobium azibense]|uniref:dATP/dGTP diphosphohydrolase N-terminal domain-containing protein n=1 Tax=Rhizobium azibense TaxID=1136135 RepID=A0A4R3RGK7_9HYPH|nr:dATP/dGTP diphosphohydrolase domain-containing protein [Rhizobium azibense]TCU34161.1 hypothetical protein EV129_113146 [Rhizobium azibense]
MTAETTGNPKQANGEKKPPLAYVPMVANLAMLEALYDGALKYEPHNWRDHPVKAMTYVHAAERHLKLFSVGEELTRDTLVKNLGAVMASCAILLDAHAHDTLIDDRRHSQVDADALYAAEAWVNRLQQKQREREQAAAKSADT